MSAWLKFKDINGIIFSDINPSQEDLIMYREGLKNLKAKETKLYIGEFLFIIYSFDCLSKFQAQRAFQLFCQLPDELESN